MKELSAVPKAQLYLASRNSLVAKRAGFNVVARTATEQW